MKGLKFLAGIAVLSIVLSACLQEPHSGPAMDQSEVRVVNLDADYTEGDPIGLTVHFADKDQQIHGLPASGNFVATSGVDASAKLEMSTWVGVDADQQRVPFECFGPIEIRDEQSTPLLIIEDFCPLGPPNLNIFGDVRTGTDVRWEFSGSGGEQVVHLDDQ